MDDRFNSTLNYFIEYETHNRLNNVCINSANSSTITLDKLNDIEYLKRYLQEKKRDYLKRELSFFIKDKEVFNNIVGKILDLDIKQKEKLKFNISNIIKSNLANLNDILNEKINKITESLSKELIVVLYPIYQVGDKRFSLISSYCKIENNKLSVQEYKISQDLLDKLLLDKYNITLEEHFGDKTIKDEFFIALNSMNNSNISELKDLVIGELKNKIEKLKDELLNEQWNQAIITIDELSDNYFSPFRDEIMLLKDISKDKKSSLVNKYIFPQNKEHIDQLKVSSHFGSYTNEYVVNEKQWKVVNAIRSNQLISVTGPPGTGKTTVIKEIIADSFVEKTKKIIELWDEEWSEIDLKNSSIFLSPLGGTNFKSILVTSTNNEAVDNIGQEIIKEILYLCNNKEKDISSFCAKLGKKDNVDNFYKNVFERKVAMLELYEDIGDDNSQQLIKEFNKIYLEIENFNNAVKSYKHIKENIILNYKLEDIDKLYEHVIREENGLKRVINNLNNETTELKKQINEQDSNIEEFTRNNRIDKSEMSKVILEKEPIVVKIDKSNKARTIKFIGQFLSNILYGDMNITNQKLININSKIDDLNTSIDRRENRIKEIENNQKINISKIKDIEITLKELTQKQRDYINYLKEYNNIKTEFDKLEIDESPEASEFTIYNNKIILEKRYLLFNLSLKINEKYIFKNRDKILNNLQYVRQNDKWFKTFYNSSYKYSIDQEKKIRCIWETFFLCFPVVTTTLHSFDRNKFHMIKGLFDTVLVDEAGQILPYYLVSPLYRVKKAAIVGDVLQLQPIRKSKINIFDKYEKYLPSYINAEVSSAQHYANEGSDIYELLKGDSAGIILEEHRRCEKSIASFSNEYVYDNRMKIYKNNKEKDVLKNNVCFIDIRGEKNRYNINDSEIRVCIGIIKELLKKYKPDEIGIISPYKNQVLEIKKMVHKNISVGTVHSFQGKGKEVIIMSMTVASINDRGGIRFIGGEANFLNVAFTRAKQQLIIIGNYELLEKAKKGNYLENMNTFIKKYGKLYSIYNDNTLKNIEAKYLNQFYRILASDDGIKSTKYNNLFGDFTNAGGLIIDDNHYKLLLNLFNYAEKKIQIVSPWVTTTIVNEDFLKQIKEYIKNDKIYTIIFGYNNTKYTLNTDEEIERIVDKDSLWKNQLNENIELIKNLKNILKDNLIYRPPLHTKAIIIDDEYLIIGSHNWLLKKGQRKNSREEVSCIIKDKGMIEFLIKKLD